jgi:hypothetical protein
MNILLLIKSDNTNLLQIDECKTRMEFFAYTIKMLIPDYINVSIKNISQNLSTILPIPDHTIYINETGFYFENPTIKKSLKNTISSFAISNKFYTCEDVMFGITKNTTNYKYLYISPPLNEDIYIQRFTDYFTIFFDNINQTTYNICDILKKMGVNDNIMICTIDSTVINYYDLDLNLVDTIYFNSYLEYINELTKGNIYFVTSQCSDVYKLYELAMCNIITVSNKIHINPNIINDLSIFTYTDINNIKWELLFESVDTYNVRDKLIMDNYSWSNAITIIMNGLDNNINISESDIKQIKFKTLNINNLTKPNIICNKPTIHDDNVMGKICDILEITPIIKTKPKRRILLQSQLLSP